MTLSEAAEKLGISVSYLSEIERDKKSPSLEVLAAYSEVYRMPVSSIMFFAEQQENEGRSGKLRVAIAGKALKILEWANSEE